MTRAHWKKLILTIPKGTTYQAAADKLGQSYHQTRQWMVEFGKQNKTYRKRVHFWRRQETILKYGKLDYRKSDAQLGREQNRSRERMRQIRLLLGKPRPAIEHRGKRFKIAA